jgi:hypothetical protein
VEYRFHADRIRINRRDNLEQMVVDAKSMTLARTAAGCMSKPKFAPRP